MDPHSADLLQAGTVAAREGRKAEARRVFRDLLSHDPSNIAGLLWMAWLSEQPRASLSYAERALALEPDNQRALAARRWARARLSSVPSTERPAPEAKPSEAPKRWSHLAPLVALGALIAFLAGTGLVILRYSPHELSLIASLAETPCTTPTAMPSPTLKSSATPVGTTTSTASPTATETSIATPTPTPIHTPTRTATSTPTSSPTASAIFTPSPTVTPRPTDPPPSPTPEDLSPARSSFGGDVRWIDVDLGRQTLTAYEGLTPVRSTLISAGLPGTPTPVGKYHIYIKLRYDDMSGPGYYLPDVPYTMYFLRGYGIHGTYWHNNFGHPMSHGCVNLPTVEAQWLFHWASVGTLVNIHY